MSGMKNEGVHSDCPGDRVPIIDPTPRLVCSESNKLIVTNALTFELVLTATLTNPIFPLPNDETGFPC